MYFENVVTVNSLRFRYIRMTPERFEHLLSLVGPLITKVNTKMRQAISAAERLTLTLRYLARGDDQQSISFSYRIGKTTVSHIIKETLNAIWYNTLKDKYVSHIAMQFPKNSGSLNFNYKGWFSIVLMAVSDASYNFTLVDIGQYDSTNDSSVLNNSEMGKAFEDGSMSLPQPEHLPGCRLPQLLFYLVGDEIFALKPWLLRPYPGKNIKEEESIFNYRLSRARRVIENCFGILVARWRIFCRAIQAKVETVQAIVQAAICLHNYLRQTDTASYCPAGFVDSFDDSGNILPGEWRRITSADEDSSALRNLPAARGTRYRNYALDVREALKAYVNSDQGAVPW